ncbi:MAG: acyl-CoA dehydrogenase family protein [Myxococcota bacterium]|nr:acyl-CoA dehydrogenase family protein [Myxococcota bacterium]
MDFEVSEDQEFFQETTRKFLESELPLVAVRRLADQPSGFDREWWRRGADLGWTSMLVPEEHGGGCLAGEGLLDLVIVAEEMGRLVSPGPWLVTTVVADAVASRGTREQREALLPAIASGEAVATWAFSEPGGGWRADDVKLEAVPHAGGFTLQGAKLHVEAAGEADHFLVTARTGGNLTQFLVPADTPGVTALPMESLDLVRRFGELRFDDVRLPASALLGEVGAAAGDIERQLEVALVIQCAETVGVVDRVFEFTLEYMFDRFSFGRPLASYQALKHRVADMKLWLEASHATATAAARAVQARSQEAGKLVSAAKSYIGDHSTAIIQECVQMHGGMGVTWEHDIHLYLRRATVNRVEYGTPSEHRERVAVFMGVDGAQEASADEEVR